jgi:hypothetical protein
MAQVLAAVPVHGLDAVLVAAELALEAGKPSGEHVLNDSVRPFVDLSRIVFAARISQVEWNRLAAPSKSEIPCRIASRREFRTRALVDCVHQLPDEALRELRLDRGTGRIIPAVVRLVRVLDPVV